MTTFTPNELTYPFTPSAIGQGNLTTTYSEAVLGSGFGVARERDDVLRHIGVVEALRASVGAERRDALVAAGLMPTGVWL